MPEDRCADCGVRPASQPHPDGNAEHVICGVCARDIEVQLLVFDAESALRQLEEQYGLRFATCGRCGVHLIPLPSPNEDRCADCIAFDAEHPEAA